ncbi:MAG: DUF6498-containing protein [Pseudomonadales bacterium]|nr:DUF6498-containing protein [Pseudomonadales bacterium]
MAKAKNRLIRNWARLQMLGDMAPGFCFGLDLGRRSGDDLYRSYPFKRHPVGILISGAMLLGFSIPLFSIFSSLPAADGELFSLVFIAFSVLWALGWSMGVLLIAAVFLILICGRETLRVREGRLILRIGIPGFSLGFSYPGTLIRNFRAASRDGHAGSTWRGEHLAFDFAGDRIAFASQIPATAAEEELATLRELFPDHAMALPDDLPKLEDIQLAGDSGSGFATEQAKAPQQARPAVRPGIEHSITSLSSLALIAANLLPLFGVLLLGWDIGELMLLFWAESAVIGFYNLLKMARVGKWAVLFFGPFFTGHFGGFMVVHLLFIYGFFINDPNAGTDIPVDQVLADFIALIPALLGFFLSHGISYVSNFLGRQEYLGMTINAQMGQPYKRIIVMHVTIIFGGFLVMALGSTLPALMLIIGLKLWTDLYSHLKEHGSRQVNPAEAVAS